MERINSSGGKKRDLVQLLREGMRPMEAMDMLDIKLQIYRSWRNRDLDFRAEVDSIIGGRFTVDGEANWQNFVEFRKFFFGHDTPPHQAKMIHAMESTKPGDITMILVFPESGKTTVFEDWACFKLSIDPEWRFMVGCEAVGMSKRILSRVRTRMSMQGPFKKWVETFGPFAPQQASGDDNSQVWAQDHFNIYKRQEYDERDYSMAALGFGSNVIGTRTDHLHLDDIQSRKTMGRTEEMFLTLQQDWLTRPGESGVTTMNGTRAGDGDIYEAAMTQWEGQPWFRVVKLPAIVHNHETGEREPLWKHDPNSKAKNKGYTMEQLDKIRSKMGDDVWSRSYMQNPRADGTGTWSRDIIERCFNYERELYGPLPVDGAPIYIGLDPALGGINCLMAWQITGEKMYLVDVKKAINLQRNEDIFLELEVMLRRLRDRGGRVSEVIVEAMNFQRGLSRDDRFERMSNLWGFAKREHMTNWNKYNEDIGVASMPTSFIQGQIDLPYAPEELTRVTTNRFVDELVRWKPGIKGNLLRQDEVMAMWFVWIKWQDRRKAEIENEESAFKTAGLPWAPTNSGILIPTGASPFRSFA